MNDYIRGGCPNLKCQNSTFELRFTNYGKDSVEPKQIIAVCTECGTQMVLVNDLKKLKE